MEENKKQYNKIKQNEMKKNNKKKNNVKVNENHEELEDVTLHGEFVSSYFVWLTPEKQKRRAKEIDNMTK